MDEEEGRVLDVVAGGGLGKQVDVPDVGSLKYRAFSGIFINWLSMPSTVVEVMRPSTPDCTISLAYHSP